MERNKLTQLKSFRLILFTTFMFMSGYITQRISLTVYLYRCNYNVYESYSIATSYISLFAICSLVWGFISKYLPKQEIIACISVLAISVGLALLSFPQKRIQLAGISFIIIGGSLYFTFTGLLVNQHFDSIIERQQGNHLYQITFNIGAVLGTIVIGLLPIDQYYVAYRFGSMITLLGFILLLKNAISITGAHTFKSLSSDTMKNLYFSLLSSLLLIYILVEFGNITRLISTIAFVAGCTYIVFESFKEGNTNYLRFLFMLIFCGFPYWVAISIVYSQFTIFLTHQVNSTLFGINISPMMILTLDAIANVIFGYTIYRIYKKYHIQSKTLLMMSLVLTTIAFLFLVVPLYSIMPNQKVSLIYPIMMISIYAVAEFLLLTTLTTQISNLVRDKNKYGIFMSMEYLGSAFCASIAYYFIHYASKIDVESNISSDSIHLYQIMLIFTLVLTFIFYTFSKFKLIGIPSE